MSVVLKNYFKLNKQIGGKDRKYISSVVFGYYRLGKLFNNNTLEEKLLLGIFFTSNYAKDFTPILPIVLQEKANFSIKEKIREIPDFNWGKIFPCINEISKQINAEAFAISHLQQPNVFVRIRPTMKNIVIEKLEKASVNFCEIKHNCLAFNSATPIDKVLIVDKEVVVQDYSSQRVYEFLELVKFENDNTSISVWDCCAASGGKSILAFDFVENINLTVSDVRPQILLNLKKRFETAGINTYQSFITDLATSTIKSLPQKKYNLIILDAPCTGSGTWGRTPEQLAFFNIKKIKQYQLLQQKIIQNSVESLGQNSYFLYITCSIFQKENEENIAFILQQFPHLQLIKQELLVGYQFKADTLFAALFKN